MTLRGRLKPEDDIHYRVVAGLRAAAPRIVFWHTPNESMIPVQYRAKLARMGLQTGVSDLVISTPPPLVPGAPGAMLELKAGRNKPTPDQYAWLETHRLLGWATAWTNTLDAAFEQLWAWGYWVPDVRRAA